MRGQRPTFLTHTAAASKRPFGGRARAACRAIVVTTAALPFLVGRTAIPAAWADELQDLKQQIDTLQKRVSQLEVRKQQREQRQKPSAGLQRGPVKGSFVIPGTNTALKFGGFVQADMQSDFGGDPGDTWSAANIPLDSGSNTARSNRHLRLTARDTRINLATWTPTPLGEAKGFFEMDFRGNEPTSSATGSTIDAEGTTNSYSPRLRHAYFELGPWLAGQTYSTFISRGTSAQTVGWVGTEGGMMVRQAQLRYTFGFGPALLQLSVENPESDVKNIATGDGKAALTDHYPDVVGRMLWTQPWAHGDIAYLSRWLSVHQDHVRADQYAYGLAANMAVPTFGEDELYLQSEAGRGIGRYLNSKFSSGYMIGTGVDLTRDFGYRIGYKHVFTKNFYLTASGGEEAALPSHSVVRTSDVMRTWSTAGDLFYRPFPDDLPGFWTAVEYAHGHRRDQDGGTGSDDRVDVATKFAF